MKHFFVFLMFQYKGEKQSELISLVCGGRIVGL